MGKKILLIILIIILFLPASLFSAENENVQPAEKDYVIILHGIARNSGNMQKMAKFLSAKGYEVINIDYASTKYDLEKLADNLAIQLADIANSDRNINFVTHSMGALLARIYINKYRPQNLGRVVQIAPPNNGSEIADLLQNNILFKFFYGPAGKQLITDQSEIKTLLGEINYELGIIAGNRTLDPFSSAIIPGRDDGRVSIKNTKIEGMKDHIIIASNHTFIINNKQTLFQVDYFLSNGKFFRNNKDSKKNKNNMKKKNEN